jgi:non-homologous end joining protein Ku
VHPSVSGPTMVVETMHWPEEIRDAKFEELHARPKCRSGNGRWPAS